MKSRVFLFVLPALVGILIEPAPAFCGLQSCPRPAGSGETPRLEAGLRMRWVAYDIAGNEGRYLVTAPRLFLNRSGLAVGVEIPFTRLDNRGSVATGLSNPVLMARYASRLSYAWSAEAGLQWELPAGNQKDGLAGDHHMLLPWMGARRDFGASWYAAAMFGYSHALGDGENASPDTGVSALGKSAHAGHDHDAAPVLVNPHADRELQGRAAVGWTRGRGTLELFSLGQVDVTGAGVETKDYHGRAGASYEWSLARFTAVQVIVDMPVTMARRNDAEAGASLKTGW